MTNEPPENKGRVIFDATACPQDIANRASLKEKGIKLLAKPPGRPSAVEVHLSPGERNPIEGKFGHVSCDYGTWGPPC